MKLSKGELTKDIMDNLRAIRTNNDAEGWHNGLNRRALRLFGFVAHFLLSSSDVISIFICIFLIFFSGKKSASPVHADPAASRREPLNDSPNLNGFGAQTMQTPATNLPAAARKVLQPVGSTRER